MEQSFLLEKLIVTQLVIPQRVPEEFDAKTDGRTD
jgi:hypothetical protein